MKNFTNSGRVLLFAFLNKFLTAILLACSITAFAIPGDSAQRTITDPYSFAIVFTQQPVATTVCEGSSAVFNVTATGSGVLGYQWQVSTNGGASWSAVVNGAVYSGANTSSLQISNVSFSMNSWRYRCVVSDGGTGTSASALLTVNAAPTVQSANIGVQVCISGSATITASASAGITYQWQVNTGSGFSNVVNGGIYAGAATTSLRITGVPASMEGYLYRYVATNTTTGCTGISALDTLHVLPYAAITQQPVSATVCPGFDTSFSVAATGAAAIKWQVSTNGSTWTDVINNATYSGATGTTLDITGVTVAMNNFRYRAVLSNALSCAVSSNTVFLFVRSLTSITTQPANTTVCATNTASFSVAATGSTLTYQWQTDNGSNGASWANITPGGTSTTLTRSNVTMSMNGYRFRVIVNGYCGSTVSAEAILQTKKGTWLGVTSTDWHTASNWCGGVPDSTTDVLIPAAAPRMPDILADTGYSKSLTIESGAKLTVSGGLTKMSGPFSILGTVAYTGFANQKILPAAHGSLEINGSGNKYLQAATDVSQNLVLNGTAKLITSNYIITMKAGSNPIIGNDLAYGSTSWIVTGNGNTGAANTGLGGLQYEEIRPGDGTVVFPVGPTDNAYNPLLLENKGVRDRFTVAVNDQRIAGSYAGRTIDRTWKLSEGTPGGSKVLLDLKWNKPEEEPNFDSSNAMMVRSANSMMVESRKVKTPSNRPYARTSTVDFSMLTEFSLHTFIGSDAVYLPVKLTSFHAEKLNDAAALISWSVEDEQGAKEYVVQKSAFVDRGFTNISTITGEYGKNHYRFTDEKLEKATSYYRLKTVEQSGNVHFSPIAKLLNAQSADNFELRPSITSGASVQLSISLKTKQRLTISLHSATGQRQWTKSFEAETGNHIQPVDLSTLSKGIYFISISRSGGTPQVLSLIKQ